MINIYSAENVKNSEQNTIDAGISADLLMERAGLRVAECALSLLKDGENKILIVCGRGNNGGDGLVAARFLLEEGAYVTVFLKEDHGSVLFEKNLDILKNISSTYNGHLRILSGNAPASDEYDLIIDALFGTGLNRIIDPETGKLIDSINNLGSKVISVDIPSGINAENGHVMGTCIKADTTVALGLLKNGYYLNDGPEKCGRIDYVPLGFLSSQKPDYQAIERKDITPLPVHKNVSANKGEYGKTLVLAGSDDCYGACLMAAKSAFLSGAGMVRVCTHVNNREVLQKEIPECLFSFYERYPSNEDILKSAEWADTIVAGPGISTGESGKIIMEVLLEADLKSKILIIDADGINILSSDRTLFEKLLLKVKNSGVLCVFTPHKKELSRIKNVFGCADYDDDLFLRIFSVNHGVCMVNKDSKTRVYYHGGFINLSGNEGMATAGSGDVLAGMLGGMLFRLNSKDFGFKVATVVFIHGLCGDMAACRLGSISMRAGDICSSIPEMLHSLT